MSSVLVRSPAYTTRSGFEYGRTFSDSSYTLEPLYEDSKNAAVIGDHKSNYPYARSGGKIVENTPRVTYEKWIEGTHVYTDVVKTADIRILGAGVLGYRPGNPDYDNSVSESLTKALNSLVPDSIALGADLGEGDQVVKMFLSNAQTLAKAITHAKRGNWSKVGTVLGLSKKSILSGAFPANKWLEYQYGWKPLMSDLHDGQQKLHEKIQKGHTFESTGTSSSSVHDERVIYGVLVKTILNCSVKTVIGVRVTNTIARDINSWGLLNPLSIAWELVPFSFVVDWIMPIGNTLSALTATAGLQFTGGYRNTKATWTNRITSGNTADNTPSNGTISPGAVSWQSFSFNRDPLNGFPLPRIYVSNPFVNKKGEIKVNRVLNGLALLRTQVR